MDGLQFEHRCAELLRYRGFHKVAVTKGKGAAVAHALPAGGLGLHHQRAVLYL